MILDTACIYSGVFLKSLKLKFEKLWRDFCCLVLGTCLYDYQIKLDLLLLEINLECFVYQSQLIMVNEDPSKAASLLAACLQLACCMLAACLLHACCLWHFRHKACLIFSLKGKHPSSKYNISLGVPWGAFKTFLRYIKSTLSSNSSSFKFRLYHASELNNNELTSKDSLTSLRLQNYGC